MDRQDNSVPLNVHHFHPKVITLSCSGHLTLNIAEADSRNLAFTRLFARG